MIRVISVAVIAISLGFVSPATAQDIEMSTIEVRIVVDSPCDEVDGFLLEAIPLTGDQGLEVHTSQGLDVSRDVSPIPGVDGCYFEMNLQLDRNEVYDLRASLFTDQGEQRVSLGSATETADAVIVFHIDENALEISIATPMSESDLEVPDLLATIQAQDKEIESLKATIEALRTPEP